MSGAAERKAGDGFLDDAAARLAQRCTTSPEAVKRAIQRLQLRMAMSDAQASIAAILEVLQQGTKTHACDRTAIVESAVCLASGDHDGAVRGVGIDRIEGEHVSEEQLLEGANLFLQFLDTLAIGLGHGAFLCCDSEKRRRAEAGGHRLSGEAK